MLLILAYQDFKDRTVSSIALLILFILFSIQSILTNSLVQAGIYFGINLFIPFIQLAGLTLYAAIKNKRFVNIIDTQIGLGDILFFVLLCTVFSPANFFPFYIGSLLVAAILFFILKKLKLSDTNEVPLAGVMSVMLIIVITVKSITPAIDLYNDYWVLKIFNTKTLSHFFSFSFGEGVRRTDEAILTLIIT
ncbi:MAG: hypothetical protein HYU69_05400 [Bacteroidetes bacterium]|nr:hypothetical protein [Bacteroidota bacterium]